MEKQFVVGIDIGGTNTELGVVNSAGEILARDSFYTKKNNEGHYDTVAEYLAVLIPKLNKLIESFGGKSNFKGIGLGAPNANYNTGKIVDTPNIKWAKGIEVPMADMITEATGLECKITNDANAAAIGEMKYGVAKGKTDFIMITMGTGVGSGIVSGGNLISGYDGNAGELGHSVSVRNGRPCGCGGFGHLETYASAPGIVRTALELLETKKDTPSSLRDIPAEKMESKNIAEAAEKGDKIAIEAFEFTGKIMGEAFANFVAFSRPEFFVLFGGPAKAFPLFEKSLLDNMNKNLMPVFRGKIKVVLSELKSADAAILGASALVA